MTKPLGLKLDWRAAKLSQLPEIAHGELHLWWLPLTLTTRQQEIALQLLSDLQRNRYERQTSPQLQEAYLAGRYFLLRLLAAYTNTDLHDIELKYTRLKKPYLSDQSIDLHFNFTDTSGLTHKHGLYAFAKSHELGVDIEARNRQSNFELVSSKRFTAQEQTFIMDNGRIDPEKFLAIWTRKEAFGKATGQGINFKMNERNLVSHGKHELNFHDDEQRAWRLLQLELGNEFIASVVHEHHQTLNLRAFNQLAS